MHLLCACHLLGTEDSAVSKAKSKHSWSLYPTDREDEDMNEEIAVMSYGAEYQEIREKVSVSVG